MFRKALARKALAALGTIILAVGLSAAAVAVPASATPAAAIPSAAIPSAVTSVAATDSVDCSAITFAKGSPLDGSNYINATFIQNGNTFQMNAEINEVQAQDAAVDSASHLYVLIHAPGGDVKYPLTVAERDSGVFTYNYSTYLQGQWTVHWIQYDGHNTHYTGDLTCGAAPVAPAVTAPGCIPSSSVSYTYAPLTNSGVITVADVANSTHVLCKPFWVTATSWKYVNTAVWPQMLDVVQKLGPISTPGSYPYAAAVSCGQGDIYASDVAQPEPTATLDGPSNPFPEHFLFQMGFSGPYPTWVQQNGACATVNPKVGYELGACYQNGTAPNLFSSSNLVLVFDNSGSTVPVTFSVPNALDVQSAVSPTPPIVRTVAPGQIVKVETTPIWNQGGGYTVTMNGVYSVTIPDAAITVAPFAGCLEGKPGDPSHSNETCVGNDKVPGSITVGLETGLIYSIDGPGTANDVSPVTTKTTTGLPAGDYVVTVVAAPGYTLAGANNWPLTIKILSTVCGQLVTHPLVTPTAHMTNLSCTAAGSYTLDSNPGVVWTVNGVATSAGTYPVSATSSVQVSATPNSPNYGFDSGITNPTLWTFAFTKPAFATCTTQLTTLAFTGVSSTLWLILAGGLVFIGIGGLLFARRRFESGV